jgi:hypothetical protein
MRNVRERGSVAPIMAVGALVVGLIGVGGAAIGRLIAGRMDTQRAADAAALAIADVIRDEGIGATRNGALDLAQTNSRLQLSWTQIVDEPIVLNKPFELEVHIGASESVQVPAFVDASGASAVQALASARIGEYVSDIAGQPSKLMFVLDYSGSMILNTMPGTTHSGLDVLRQSITTILNWHLPIDYAAALFDTNLLGSEPFVDPNGANTIDRIIQLLSTPGGGSTATYLGMQTALDYVTKEDGLRGPGGGFNVVLISDGQPSDGAPTPEQAAYNIADKLRDNFAAHDPELTLWALHIDWSGGTDKALRDFMVNMTGTKDKLDKNGQRNSGHPDESFYFPITDVDSLDTALAALVARIGCPVGPLDQSKIEKPEIVSVFIRDGAGNETKLKREDSLGLNSLHEMSFTWDDTRGLIYPSIMACQEVSNTHAKVVVRYNPSHLASN